MGSGDFRAPRYTLHGRMLQGEPYFTTIIHKYFTYVHTFPPNLLSFEGRTRLEICARFVVIVFFVSVFTEAFTTFWVGRYLDSESTITYIFIYLHWSLYTALVLLALQPHCRFVRISTYILNKMSSKMYFLAFYFDFTL